MNSLEAKLEARKKPHHPGHKTYFATFWIRNEKQGWERLGGCEVDDRGLGPKLTLSGKAFRHAPPHCGIAQKVRFERIC